MISIESEHNEHTSSSSSTSSSSASASDSSTSSNSSSSTEESRNGDLEPNEHDATVTLNQTNYTGFVRKPTSESHASLGRKRQERVYSDSENSYQEEIPGRWNRNGQKFFDLEGNADRRWGRQPLWESLSAEQIESYVAWAHHGTVPDNSFWGTVPPDMGSLLLEGLEVQQDEDMTNNPLLNLVNTPLPLSYLNYFMLRAGKVPEFCDGLCESFDDSALVAIGMIVEEMITASLLPFAGCHVLRCQQLQVKPSQDEALLASVAPIAPVKLFHPISNQPLVFDIRNLPENESAFNAWTLPPEEAILRMASQGMVPDTGIPLVRDPIRSSGTRNDDFFRVCGNDEVVGRIFGEMGIDTKSNQELQDLFIFKKIHKRKGRPRQSNEDVIGHQSQDGAKRMRIIEL